MRKLGGSPVYGFRSGVFCGTGRCVRKRRTFIFFSIFVWVIKGTCVGSSCIRECVLHQLKECYHLFVFQYYTSFRGNNTTKNIKNQYQEGAAGMITADDLENMPQHQKDALSAWVLDWVRAVFSQPGAEEDYQKWLVEYRARANKK